MVTTLDARKLADVAAVIKAARRSGDLSIFRDFGPDFVAPTS